MRIRYLSLAILLLADIAQAQDRPPYVAGEFYAKDPKVLRQEIDALLTEAKPQLVKNLSALIVPHAGYRYSGKIAARAYKLLKEKSFDTIILIGPQHQKEVKDAALWPSGQWQTPLGSMPVDQEFAKVLIKNEPRITKNEELHKGEHSLEVQIPFLQVVAPKASIVPILIDDDSFAPDLANALVKTIKDFPQKKFLVIASTDMRHYRPDEEVRKEDQQTLKLIRKLDICGLKRALLNGQGELCGKAAVLTLLAILKATDEAEITPIAYGTSADASNDKKSVVGYGASMATSKSLQKAHGRDALSLDEAQKKELLSIARKTLQSYLVDKNIPIFNTVDPAFKTRQAVFVTIRKDGKLRGCIGRILPEEDLLAAVQHMAIEAATKDDRFSPVKPEELGDLKLEISILGQPYRVCDITPIKLGVHGVILGQDGQRGVFLPEVGLELPKKEDFFGELCAQKAGLKRECYQDPKTNIEIFNTTDFGEK